MFLLALVLSLEVLQEEKFRFSYKSSNQYWSCIIPFIWMSPKFLKQNNSVIPIFYSYYIESEGYGHNSIYSDIMV